MLRPSKHSNPDQTVIYTSALLLNIFHKSRVNSYETLRLAVRKKVKGGDFLFVPTLNFLYLLGLIEYYPKTDTIEYVGPNEAI